MSALIEELAKPLSSIKLKQLLLNAKQPLLVGDQISKRSEPFTVDLILVCLHFGDHPATGSNIIRLTKQTLNVRINGVALTFGIESTNRLLRTKNLAQEFLLLWCGLISQRDQCQSSLFQLLAEADLGLFIGNAQPLQLQIVQSLLGLQLLLLEVQLQALLA